MNWGFYERFNGWFEFGAFTIYPNGETWNFNGSGNEMVINCIPYEGYVIPGDPEYQLGDVNFDGVLNLTDITLLISAVIESGQIENADMNGDGEVNVTDVTLLISTVINQVN